MPSTLSLDQQYLDFVSRTAAVFTRYPQIEPLRYFIFKELLVQRSCLVRSDYLKHWLRPLLRRSHTRGRPNQADVLVWIESARETSVGALLPVYSELESRGIKVQAVSLRGPDDLPSSTLHLQYPARARPPIWAKDTWNALCDVFEGLRCPQLKQHYLYASANIQGLFDELDIILGAVQPKIVLNAVTQIEGGAALVVSSRLHRAVTLVLQHGILQPFYVPLVSDVMLTWGQSSNEILVRLGVSPDKLIALGSPRHDSMGPIGNGAAKAALRRALSLPDKPTLLFFSNGNDLVRNGAAPLECAAWLESIARQFYQELNVIVRLHPNEDGSIYRNCRDIRVTKDVPNLQVTLDGADFVGSLCSTALYEALLFRKPVLQFYADHWPLLADNWRHGLAVRVTSEGELSETLQALLRREGYGCADAPSVNRVFANHGRSAKAIADYIEAQL